MSTPRTMDGNRQHHVFSDEQMADYLDVRLRLAGCNADSVGQALLLVSELYGMGFVAAPSGLTAEAMRRLLDGSRPLHMETVLGVLHGLGLRLRVEVAE